MCEDHREAFETCLLDGPRNGIRAELYARFCAQSVIAVLREDHIPHDKSPEAVRRFDRRSEHECCRLQRSVFKCHNTKTCVQGCGEDKFGWERHARYFPSASRLRMT